jgi:hypothetical protein
VDLQDAIFPFCWCPAAETLWDGLKLLIDHSFEEISCALYHVIAWRGSGKNSSMLEKWIPPTARYPVRVLVGFLGARASLLSACLDM